MNVFIFTFNKIISIFFELITINYNEYIESLQDEREIYIYGERVKDVTKHPAFRNSVQSIARLYDALHSSESKEILTCDTDTGSGGYTHRFFRYATNSDDLFAQRRHVQSGSN